MIIYAGRSISFTKEGAAGAAAGVVRETRNAIKQKRDRSTEAAAVASPAL